VLIRSRKPWTLCRRRLLGWNVRLLTGAPVRFGRLTRVEGGHSVHPGKTVPPDNSCMPGTGALQDMAQPVYVTSDPRTGQTRPR
jgi:hypothetical protein